MRMYAAVNLAAVCRSSRQVSRCPCHRPSGAGWRVGRPHAPAAVPAPQSSRAALRRCDPHTCRAAHAGGPGKQPHAGALACRSAGEVVQDAGGGAHLECVPRQAAGHELRPCEQALHPLLHTHVYTCMCHQASSLVTSEKRSSMQYGCMQACMAVRVHACQSFGGTSWAGMRRSAQHAGTLLGGGIEQQVRTLVPSHSGQLGLLYSTSRLPLVVGAFASTDAADRRTCFRVCVEPGTPNSRLRNAQVRCICEGAVFALVGLEL
jgi:hypothetical protein